MKVSFLQPGHPIAWSELPLERLDGDLEEGIREAEERLQAIRSVSRSEVTDANTLAALEAAIEELEMAWGLVQHLASVQDSPALREKMNHWLPRISDFFSGISLDAELLARLQWFERTAEAGSLSPIRKRLLSETLLDFKLSGAGLDAGSSERLREIQRELALTTRRFNEQVLDSTNQWERLVSDPAELAGIPESLREAARQGALAKGQGSGEAPVWRFTLQAPSLLAVLRYADSEALRRELWEASQGVGRGSHNNGPLIGQILALRAEKARILGFDAFADLTTCRRMVNSGREALDFVEALHARILPRFREEVAELEAYRAEQSGEGKRHLEPWEIPYWSEKLRRERYDFDEEELRVYFPMDRVMTGMFALAEKLFRLRICERPAGEVEVWHADVRFYEVETVEGRPLGSFYTDWYPREDKRDGAWMNQIFAGRRDRDGRWIRHLGLICGNMTPAVEGKPALLTHRDVETIFHEFGHLLHLLCSEVEVPSLSGTAVALDFVELPSQLMENWCWEKESLDLFAAHYETGDPLPAALLEKVKRGRNFQAAMAFMRQLSFGKLDLELHLAGSGEGDPDAWEEDLMRDYSVPTHSRRSKMLRRFSHLFGSPTGYAGGYYSYKWSEVLDAHVFERFQNEGILNAELGEAFRQKILARGNSAPARELYHDFMGGDPDEAALLQRCGIWRATRAGDSSQDSGDRSQE